MSIEHLTNLCLKHELCITEKSCSPKAEVIKLVGWVNKSIALLYTRSSSPPQCQVFIQYIEGSIRARLWLSHCCLSVLYCHRVHCCHLVVVIHSESIRDTQMVSLYSEICRCLQRTPKGTYSTQTCLSRLCLLALKLHGNSWSVTGNYCTRQIMVLNCFHRCWHGNQ